MERLEVLPVLASGSLCAPSLWASVFLLGEWGALGRQSLRARSDLTSACDAITKNPAFRPGPVPSLGTLVSSELWLLRSSRAADVHCKKAICGHF